MSTLNLWKNFTKRKNSTKQPTGAADYSQSVLLKDGTSLEQPVFVISSNEFGYNYAQYEGSYYYVDDIVSLKNNLIEVHCSKDVLATYKSQIQAGSAYVLYYTHSNTEISDKRLSTKTTKTLALNSGSFDTLGNGTGTNYAVALNLIGVDACDTYIVSQATAREILNDFDNWFDNTGAYTADGSGILDSNDPWFSWASVEDSLKSWFDETVFFWKQWFSSGKLSDNLRSAFMLPLPVSAIGGVSTNIRLGKYKSSKTGTRINDRIFSDGASVTIPWQGITDWRRNAPYMELFLYIPYVGLINLSPSDLMGDTTINVSVSLDVTSGDAVFTVYTGSTPPRFIGQYTTNMAAPFAIGTSNIAPSAVANTILNAGADVAGSLIGGGPSGAIGSGANAIANFGNVIAGAPTCIGSNAGGAVLGLTDNIICYSIFHDITVGIHDQSAIVGEPFNGVMSLNVSGYVQTAGASIEIPGFGNDKDQVNNYLNGGIYIE